MSNVVFCLMGPTACYKTQLACELSEHFPLEIISVDSAMIYQGMDIGTAKPSADVLATYPHHLVDILNPTQAYSAAQFCNDVYSLIDNIHCRGKWPFLVGGTMMYFNALQKGLSSLPHADHEIRYALTLQAETEGWQKLHEELQKVDPVTASNLHPNDAQRIQRALEVYRLTGTPLSVLRQSEKNKSPYQFVNLILFPQQREALHKRIGWRFKQMLAENLVEEVLRLLQIWPLALDCVSLRAVGYRQVVEHLIKNEGAQQLYEKGAAATRQLAKRQLTWLRHWQNYALRIDCENLIIAKKTLISTIESTLESIV